MAGHRESQKAALNLALITSNTIRGLFKGKAVWVDDMERQAEQRGRVREVSEMTQEEIEALTERLNNLATY